MKARFFYRYFNNPKGNKMSNNIKETNVTNEVTVAPLGTTNEVENELVCSYQGKVTKGLKPIAYVNNMLGSYYEIPEKFYTSVYADILIKEVLEWSADMDLVDRQMIFEEVLEENGLTNFIFNFIDALCSKLGLVYAIQYLSRDEQEFNVLCQLECDFTVPDKFINSSFPNFIFGEELTLQQKRYHSRALGEGYALPLVDNFILGLCQELDVYVDTQFEDIR